MEPHTTECAVAKRKVRTYTRALHKLGNNDIIPVRNIDVALLHSMTVDMQDTCEVDAGEIFQEDENTRQALIHECVTNEDQLKAEACIVDANDKHNFGITADFLKAFQVNVMKQDVQMKQFAEMMKQSESLESSDNKEASNLYL